MSFAPNTDLNSNQTQTVSQDQTVGVAHLPNAVGFQPRKPLVRSFDAQSVKKDINMNSLSKRMIFSVVTMVVVVGIGSGIAVAYLVPGSTTPQYDVTETEQVTANQVKVGSVFGIPDEKTFSDETQGVLIKGGLEGEGSHTLLRPGGVSQNVYLTSSVVDLDQFETMKIKIWGETFQGQKAGWLMDVGRVEVMELKADKPDWYKE